ncbi:phage Gp37/Gp68 family protein [Luteimonas sp. FCS-9]|uniref:phage Gp37/Gp68 family protein n=1 Tax=Luteimonas sp. FCS-9 TaxID=1547516 RepID=UPI00063E915E|nr:phage Gp37/Gp68 family protein [Luteimonas sp. FCS-9]KLJ02862.1 phage Gp37Gp68 [Luteimonas sp. FCS-9]
MAETSAIEWCDSTFNPWIGCTRVSPACDHCYAAVSTPARALGVEWGIGQARRRTATTNWKLPLRWNAQHAAFVSGHGRRRRVFCASLADVFDNEVDTQWRVDLFALIRATPNLDWLLLTKRIGNAGRMIADAVSALPRDAQCGTSQFNHTPIAQWPWANVWLGATICNQAEADRDIPKLLAAPAAVRFLSMEPLLGQVMFRWAPWAHQARGQSYRQYLDQQGRVTEFEALRQIDWVIVGGESGVHARPMNPQWARDVRNQCAAAGVPFLFKQWGEWVSVSEVAGAGPHHTFDDGRTVRRAGKKLAGRTLDGATHSAWPSTDYGDDHGRR